MPNIFFTKENLVLCLPLIVVCSTYAFFRYLPLKIGIPALAALALAANIYGAIKSRQAKSLEVVDESVLKDLGADDEKKKAKAEISAAKKQRKADEKLRQRLAAENKRASRGTGEDEDDDEADALMTFAQGSRGKSKKK